MRRICWKTTILRAATTNVTPLAQTLITSRLVLPTVRAHHAAQFDYLQRQQRRWYTPATVASVCWNCQKTSERRERMICADCGHLQDVDTEINYFELLKFPIHFTLEPQALTKRFRQLQTLVHPDKFSNKSAREQTNSADWSSLLNKAYKTLSAPIERGQYLLRLRGENMPQDNSALNTSFLLDMMERNEQVEEVATNTEGLNKLNAVVMQELDEKVVKVSRHFETGDLNAAKSVLVEMRYLLSIQSSIKQKLQYLMGNS